MTETTNGFKQHLDDLQSFPILTEEVEVPTTSRPATSGAAGTSALGDIVHNALRDVLGWRPKINDPKSFVVALKQAFTPTEVEGRTAWTWTPRTYAIETDLGAITGAQASIYARAKAALEQSLPLLEGLQPLRSDADEEDLEASRAIVRSALKEIVDELGIKGGPRVVRVDELFASLLGNVINLSDPEQVGGQLGLLRDRFGMQRQFVNTVEEEQNLTNFLILVDSAVSLRLTWESQKPFFTRTSPDVFFGTQQVLLGRALGVVAESVHEAYFAMNSVFLGPAERETTILNLEITDDAGNPITVTLTVAELLDWVERFATAEGLRLIREGGKDGVIHAFVPTVEKLRDVVQAAAVVAQSNSDNPTQAFHTARVRRALNELQGHLETTFELAIQIKRLPPPVVTLVDPSSVFSLGQVRLTVEGANFQDGATMRLELPRPAQSPLVVPGTQVTVVGTTVIRATFDVPQNGSYAVIVTNPDGGVGRLDNAFNVNNDFGLLPKAPVVRRVTPPSAPNTQPVVLTIHGESFPDDPAVTLTGDQGNIEATAVKVESPSRLTATFDMTDQLVSTQWTVVVTTPGGRQGHSPTPFTIEEPPVPVVQRVTPRSAPNTGKVTLTISGRHFPADPEVLLQSSQGELEASEVTVENARRLTAVFDLQGQPPDTQWTVVVTTLDGRSGQWSTPFTIKGQPSTAHIGNVSGSGPGSTP